MPHFRTSSNIAGKLRALQGRGRKPFSDYLD
jgi:hypothetical protein